MATGRGRLLQLQWRGLLAQSDPAGGAEAGGLRKGAGTKFPAGCTHQKPRASSRQQRKGPCDSWVSLDSLPSEILLQILSYLDAITLLAAGCVNRRFYHLASDNFIWAKIYSVAFTPKKSHWRGSSVETMTECVHSLSVEAREAGYWKKEYISKQIASVKVALAQILKPVNPYTGLPAKTKEALRMSGLGWVIILRETCGKEHVLDHADLSINESSVTVMWYGKYWPQRATLATLDLCGVTPVFMDRSQPPPKAGPRWHSLIAKYNLSHLTESTMIGCDRLVRIFCLQPGLLVGLWQRDEELAFVMANLHFHRIVERSTLGSATVPHEVPLHVPLVDDSPECGLQGYQLHVDMHSGGVFSLCGMFRNLFTRKGHIEDGYVKLIVISLKNDTEHLPLIGKVGLSWKTNAFDGYIENCSILDITVLDERGRPFWCLSSPVSMAPVPVPSDGPHFSGRSYCVDYVDAEGRVHVELVWVEETEEFFIVSLVLFLSIAKVNRWFGTRH